MMNLAQLIQPYLDAKYFSAAHRVLTDLSISGLVTDNRDVQAGDCFVALAGITHHGKNFIDDAIARGASAILLETDEPSTVIDGSENKSFYLSSGIPVICLPELKHQLNAILIDFYLSTQGAQALPLLAVTGTNGKSSITRFVAQMSDALNQPCGLMGTLGFGVWPAISASKNTTPELAVLLRQFALMKEQGAQLVAMEVSSHGIEQKRIEGLTFASAVFANLTQDHLDYHGDMESYFAIKRGLFLTPGLTNAIINIDDEYGQRLMADEEIKAHKISYGFSSEADVRVTQWSLKGSGIQASISSPWGDASFSINMVGDFNLANVMAAICLLAVDGQFSLAEIISAISAISPAPGRMQAYSKDNSVSAVIDFAHTPDALMNVLSTLRKQTQGKLAVVFGCGGDRDVDKRPQMTKIAQALADEIILTSDNPRSEDANTIIADMKAGLDLTINKPVAVELNRETAIAKAISELAAEDMLLIAGKGHEDYQDIKGEKIPYSDETVLLALGYQDISQKQMTNKEVL